MTETFSPVGKRERAVSFSPRQYLKLTKPTIMLLVLLTGAAALVWEGSMLQRPLDFLLVLLGLYLTGGCANALNQYFERDIDAQMSRTQRRRPLPVGALSPGKALAFALAIGVAGVLLFGIVFNWLTAALSLATILFYALLYTLWLKPTTYLNIVIGGAAGAMAPVGAWAAATGQFSLPPWTIFLIVFLWTPPHFWSLAILCKEDYRRVDYPMLPTIKGDAAALRQILSYSVMLFVASLLPLVLGAGWLYAASAAALGGRFLQLAWRMRRNPTTNLIRSFFGFSIVYLLILLLALIIDRLAAPFTAWPF
ncbi:MAG: heme o synthase [bacterium]